VAKQLWGEERVTFEHLEDGLCSVPVGWMDVVPTDPYLSIGADGRIFAGARREIETQISEGMARLHA